MIANLIGPSGSGKTTLVSKIEELYPFLYRRLISYTSRIKRVTEKEGESYHFVDKKMIENKNDFVLQRVREDGIYAIKKDDLYSTDNKIILTTFPASGILKLQKLGCIVAPFFLSVGSDECEKRMIARGDDPADVRRRILADLTESTLEITRSLLGDRNLCILNGMLNPNELALSVHQILSAFRNEIE